MTAATSVALLLPATGVHAAGARGGGEVAGAPAVGPSTSDAHFLDGKTLLLDGRLGHPAVARDPGRAATFLLATVTGAEPAGERPAAPPAHLAIVIDRSGSMAGIKMSNAIAAAAGAVERMRDGDRATVVAFDTTARVIVPPTLLDAGSRPGVQAAIRAIRPGGDTCISCAITRATESLDAAPGPRDEVRRVLLISDGEATTGIRDIGGLRALSARARDHGLAVSTIGVDLAFDEKVMAAIAQESNGRHWFVPDPRSLAQVFDEELGSLEAAVATDAELTIDPDPGVVIEEVHDRAFRREGRRIVVPLGTFDAGQERTVLLSIQVPADQTGSRAVAHMSLAYRDVARRQDASCRGDLAVDVRDDGSAPRELDPFVAARVERSRTAHALLEANDLFSRGKQTEARAALASRQDELARAAPKALSRAATLTPAATGAARDVRHDFGAQEAALDSAQAGFARPPAPSPAGAPAAAAASAAGEKSALKRNQATATDLAF